MSPSLIISGNFLPKKTGAPVKRIEQEKAPTVEAKLGRLKYNGQMDNWSFAVFRYSNERYDPDEFMFPGAEQLRYSPLSHPRQNCWFSYF